MLRYGAAACQVDQPNPERRDQIARNTARMLEMNDAAIRAVKQRLGEDGR